MGEGRKSIAEAMRREMWGWDWRKVEGGRERDEGMEGDVVNVMVMFVWC